MKKIKKMFFGNNIRQFLTMYAFVTLLFALLLMMPVSLVEGATLSFVDALFISVSGISTTGLSTVVIADTLSRTGQVILAMLLQFGGIGLIMLIGIFWMAIGKKIGYRERNMIMQDQNQVTMVGALKLVKNILLILFIVELTAFLTLGTYFVVTGTGGFDNPVDSYFNAFFLTISLITNAGFDITGNSLIDYKNDYFVQSIAMALMFIGAVGFWPLVEVKEYIVAKIKKRRYKFSMFTKIVFKVHVFLWIFGALVMYAVEVRPGNFLEGKNFIESAYYSFFMSLSTRNAGFATVNMSELSETTHMLFNVLMFLGSSPNSAGGGIRSTTFIVVVLAVYSYALGRNQVVINKRSINQDSVLKAFTITVTAIAIVIVSTILILVFEPNITLSESLFEVSSAFGTTGLSLGITSALGTPAKIILIITMYIGRVGVITVLMLLRKHNKNDIKYPEISLIIG